MLAQSIYTLLGKVDQILKKIIGLLFLLGTAIFLWGCVQYISAGGDAKKIREARLKIIYGGIGLALMVAMWGIAKALVATFGL